MPDNEYLLFNFLVNRLTWAEAAWSSIPALSWQHVVLGDPLARLERVVDWTAYLNADGESIESWDSESADTGNATPQAVEVRLTVGPPARPQIFTTRIPLYAFREATK